MKNRGGIRLANKNNYQNEFNNESPDIVAARLALIGTILTTLGDGLTTIASGIVLQQLLENNNSQQNSQNSKNQIDQSKQLERLQKQVDYLTRKMEKGNRSK